MVALGNTKIELLMPASPGSFIHPKSAHGVLIELVQSEP